MFETWCEAIVEWLYGSFVTYLTVHVLLVVYVTVFSWEGARAIPVGIVAISAMMAGLFSFAIVAGNHALVYLGWRRPFSVSVEEAD